MILQVARIETVAEGIKRLEFRDPDGKALPGFEPGAHVRLQLTPELSRRYSLISDPADRSHYAIAVLRHENGQGSSLLHALAQEGNLIEAEEPINGFPLADAPHTILIAGGIGVTPILSHARELSSKGASFELHYAARTRTRLAFSDLAQQYAKGGAKFYIGSEGGRLNVAALLAGAPPDTHVCVCGPKTLLDAVREAAANAGWPPERVHMESFGAAWESTDEEVHLELTLSGSSLDVPVGKTLLEAMEEAGVWVPYDCRRGECHMCMTHVVAGEPIHRDHCLTAGERASAMTPCISWARGGRLALEL